MGQMDIENMKVITEPLDLPNDQPNEEAAFTIMVIVSG